MGALTLQGALADRNLGGGGFCYRNLWSFFFLLLFIARLIYCHYLELYSLKRISGRGLVL